MNKSRMIQILGTKNVRGKDIVPNHSPQKVEALLTTFKEVQFKDLYKVRESVHGGLTKRSKLSIALYGKPKCDTCGRPLRPCDYGAHKRNKCHYCRRTVELNYVRLTRLILGELGTTLHYPYLSESQHLMQRNILCYIGTLNRKVFKDEAYATISEVMGRSQPISN